MIHAPSRRVKGRTGPGNVAGLAAGVLAVLAAIAAGCSGASSKKSHLTVTVQVDSALDIDQVAVALAAPGKSDLSQTFPIAPPSTAPVTWSVDVASVSAGTTVTVTAQGNKAGTTKITAIATVALSPGGTAFATLRLDAACVDVTCPSGYTCTATSGVGLCVPIPQAGGTDGGGMDLGADVSAGSGGASGSSGGASGMAGSTGSGGTAGGGHGGGTGGSGQSGGTPGGGGAGAGGMTVATGGAGGTVASTGGTVASTGGTVASTGGMVASTGGMVASTGGTVASTGGTVASTGGVIGTGGVPACGASSHMCSSGCVMNNLTSSCGTTSCTPCQVPTNGSATCNGTACGVNCSTNYHSCDNTSCSSNMNTATCGSRCTACATPTNGTPTCDGTSCGIMCNSNYHACGTTTCASNTDPTMCGSGCTMCPGSAIANSAPTCNGACGVGCATNYRSCTGSSGLVSCNRLTYDFNDNTAQGWVAATTPVPPSMITVGTSTSIRRGTSGSSLQVQGTFGVFGSGTSFGVTVPLCASGAESINGRSVSAWVYIDANLPDCSPGINDMGIFLYSAENGNGAEVASGIPVVKTWFQVTGTVTDASVVNPESAGIFIEINCTNSMSWPITFYVDDVTIGG